MDSSLIQQTIEVFTNPWVIFGFAAQFIFFLRFFIQWAASEKAKETTVPVSFWYLSIIGATMILIYAIYRKDIVFMAGQALALVMYTRNLIIYYRAQSHNAQNE